MMTTAELAGNALGAFLAEDFKRTFGSSEAHLAHEIDATAQVALECISNSENTGLKRNERPSYSIGVSRPVPSLMVVRNDH